MKAEVLLGIVCKPQVWSVYPQKIPEPIIVPASHSRRVTPRRTGRAKGRAISAAVPKRSPTKNSGPLCRMA